MKFIPLRFRPSSELKKLVRAVDGSIRKSLPVPLDADKEYKDILEDLGSLSRSLKLELACRMAKGAKSLKEKFLINP